MAEAVQITNAVEISKIGSIGEVSKVKGVEIASFPCPKVNDAGLEGAWWWANAIAIAVALWATAEQYKAEKERYKIGKEYYDLAKEQWDFFYNHYRPLEDQELKEIWAEQPYTPDYSGAVAGHTNLIENAFDNADRQRLALIKRYCVCYDVGTFTKTDMVRSTVSGDSNNFARRYAEQLAQEKNDIRWARRVAAAARGRSLLSTSTAFATKAVGFFNDYAQAMGGFAQGAMQFSGYIQNRAETTYNPARARINPRAEVPDFYSGQNVLPQVDNISYYQSMGDNSQLGWKNMDGRALFLHSGFDPAEVVQGAPRI